MASIRARLRTLFFGKHFVHAWLRTLLLVNPLVTAGIVAVTGPHLRVGWSFFFGYLFATIVSSVCIVVGRAATTVVLAVLRRRGGTANPHTSWRLAVAFSIFALPFGHWLAMNSIFWVGSAAGLQMPEPSWQGSGPYLLLGCGLCGVFFLWREQTFAKEALQRTRLQLETSENAHLHAQLAALTAQLNPHLLFNALNTVASLIESDPKRAEHTVVRLSALYRGVLGASQRTQHSLAEELALCRAYLDVEHARFGERMTVEIRISPGALPEEVQVPVLVLQPLVENAVKHGLSRKASGGHVQIDARREGELLVLAVEDDGVGFGNSPRQGTGTGIPNCRKRLELVYGGSASLEVEARNSGGTRVLLKLPVWVPTESAA